MSGGARRGTRVESLKAASKHPGRIANFANIDWSGMDDEEWANKAVQELTIAVEYGFAGLKVSKALGLGVPDKTGALMAVDDPKLDPLWKAAGDLGIVVGIHTGDPKAFFEPPGPENERHAELSHAPSWSFHGDEFPSREELLAARDRLIAKHPNTTFMLLHFANNPEDIDYVDRLLTEHPNVLVDVAARLGEIGRHERGRVRELFQKHGDRILFATDFQMSMQVTGQRGRMRVTLGSVSESPPGTDDISPFYQKHFDYFEGNGEPIAHPIPIQGDWKINPIGLSESSQKKLYFENAEREIFAPWLARNLANKIERRAVTTIRSL